MKMRGRLQKTAMRMGLAAVLVTGFIGVLHAPFARPWLMKMGGCPVGKASAAEVEEGRMQAVRKTRGAVPSPSRPALGFVLDRSTPEDVRRWAEEKGLSCKEKREGMLLTCRDVPASVLSDRPEESGTIDEVSFAFRPRDRRLVNASVMSFGLSPDEAARRMTASIERVRPALGAPMVARGDVTPARFSRDGYVTSTVSYSFSDYEVQMNATTFGRGVALREQYLSATE